MRTRISSIKIQKLWKKKHPKTRLPNIKAYFTTKKELNSISDNSQKGKGRFKQETKREYGKENAISSKTHNIGGLVYKNKNSYVVLIRKEAQNKNNRALSHELNHIFEKCKRRK